MKYILILLLLVSLGIISVQAATWEERQATIKNIVEDEVERLHQYKMVQIKAEAYAKELQLQAPKVNVSVKTGTRNTLVNSNSVRNSNKAVNYEGL